MPFIRQADQEASRPSGGELGVGLKLHFLLRAKQRDGHHQAPEMEFLAVAKGMPGIRGLAAALSPSRNRHSLPVSTVEWIASDRMAELPEK